MSNQYYFVVSFDTETNTFELDYEVQEMMFDSKPVYSDGEFRELSTNEIHNDESVYNQAGDAIHFAVTGLSVDMGDNLTKIWNQAKKGIQQNGTNA